MSYFRIRSLVPSPLVMLKVVDASHAANAGAAVHQDHPDLVSTVDCHRRSRRLSWCRTALWKPPCFPTSCFFLQVTPIVAIAPLIIIWVKDATLAGGVRHPDGGVSHHLHTQGLRSVSPAC